MPDRGVIANDGPKSMRRARRLAMCLLALSWLVLAYLALKGLMPTQTGAGAPLKPPSSTWREVSFAGVTGNDGTRPSLRLLMPRDRGVHEGLSVTVQGQILDGDGVVDVFVDGIWVWPRGGAFETTRWFDTYGPATIVVEVRHRGRVVVLEYAHFDLVPSEVEDDRRDRLRRLLRSRDRKEVIFASADLYLEPDLRLTPVLLEIVSGHADRGMRNAALLTLVKTRAIDAVPVLIGLLGAADAEWRSSLHVALDGILFAGLRGDPKEALHLGKLAQGPPAREQEAWRKAFLKREARLRAQLGQWAGRPSRAQPSSR